MTTKTHHPLRLWAAKTLMKDKDAALRIGITGPMYSNIINGKVFPAASTISKIYAATGGEITFEIMTQWADENSVDWRGAKINERKS